MYNVLSIASLFNFFLILILWNDTFHCCNPPFETHPSHIYFLLFFNFERKKTIVRNLSSILLLSCTDCHLKSWAAHIENLRWFRILGNHLIKFYCTQLKICLTYCFFYSIWSKFQTFFPRFLLRVKKQTFIIPEVGHNERINQRVETIINFCS